MRLSLRFLLGLMLAAVLALSVITVSGDSGGQQVPPPEGVPIQFAGRVQSVNTGSIVVNQQLIDVRGIPALPPLQVGQNVAVSGFLLPDGRIIANTLNVTATAVVTATPRPPTPLVPTPVPIARTAPGRCPLPQTYWLQNADRWPVNTLMIGNHTYTKNDLAAILALPVNTDASVRLARQLIAAKLNLANGSAAEPVGNIVLQSDVLLGNFDGFLPFNVLPTSPVGPAMVTNAELLDSYNNNLMTPNCLQTSPPQPTTPTEPDTNVIVLEGPVDAFDGAYVIVYGFRILIDVNNPVRVNLERGDVIRVQGILHRDDDDNLLLIATGIERRGGDEGSNNGRGNGNRNGNANGRGNGRGDQGSGSGRGNGMGDEGS